MLHAMTTARLHLRRPLPGDAPAFFDMFADAETCRMDGGYPPYAAMDDAFDRDFASVLETADDRLFLSEAATGRLVGVLHVMPGGAHGEVEVGFVIHRALRRRGYAREAVTALLGQLRDDGIARAVATCYAFNDASAALLLRLGVAEGAPIPNAAHPEFSQRSFSIALDTEDA